jgi:hypothetical protein
MREEGGVADRFPGMFTRAVAMRLPFAPLVWFIAPLTVRVVRLVICEAIALAGAEPLRAPAEVAPVTNRRDSGSNVTAGPRAITLLRIPGVALTIVRETMSGVRETAKEFVSACFGADFKIFHCSPDALCTGPPSPVPRA